MNEISAIRSSNSTDFQHSTPLETLNLELEQQWRERMEKLQRSLELAKVQKHVTDQIRSSLDSKTVLNTIVREVRQLLNTDRVVMYRFGQDWMGEVVVEAVQQPWNAILGQRHQDDCFPADHGQQYLEGRVRAIDHVAASDLAECHKALLQTMQVQANLVVPIRVMNQLWGLLIAHECRAPRSWQPYEIDLLQQLADQAAIALHQAELYEQSCIAAATAKAQAQQLKQTTNELSQALQKLQKTQSQLVQTEKMSSLGQLMAGVAHEINNPVSFIYGNLGYVAAYAQDLLKVVELYQERYPHPDPITQAALEAADVEFLKQDFPKMLVSMKVGADRIHQIVRSLQNFSRHDQAEKKLVDLHQGIDSTLLILQHRLKAVGNQPEIQIVKEYGNLPLVECYPGELNQVFMNLLSNAIDALEGGCKEHEAEEENEPNPFSPPACHLSPQIRICTEAAPDRVIIRMIDNGTGISEETKAHLFDPFFTTKPVGKGTGLGLAISYQIMVEKHNGSIECHSQPGQGTEFRLEIPFSGGY